MALLCSIHCGLSSLALCRKERHGAQSQQTEWTGD
jgi:hypothetical protein